LANHVIYPLSRGIIIKCENCKALYVADKVGAYFVEKCPVCNYLYNDMNDRIPLWKYNLIKFFRSKINEMVSKCAKKVILIDKIYRQT